mmetsp:Transcript_22122/g.22296  ORF Transcript_22122/g.22296 Transcript_22122/m.22296 type:complete len:435 (-) Transcript_22122:157-1461(-)
MGAPYSAKIFTTSLIVILICLILSLNLAEISDIRPHSFESNDVHNEHNSRGLAEAKGRQRRSGKGRGGGRGGSGKSGPKSKASKLAALVSGLTAEPLPEGFEPESWSKPHRRNVPYAIFAAAMSVDMMPRDVKNFAGTARKVGFDGDIVLAMEPGMRDSVIDMFKKYEAVMYNVKMTCQGNGHAKVCNVYNTPKKYSINVIRYHLYYWWSTLYEPETLIMISDFRDVFFQSNPFLYKPKEWAPPAAQLVVFQEAHPNSVIDREPFNRGWIRHCYGQKALEKIGHNTVSCSGVSMGTRDAILVYSYLMTLQTLPKIRLMPNATAKDFQRCISPGMDQGFHNWMIYSGMLNRYMDVRIFQQGEGPVNTVGGFFGDNKRLKFTLEEWGIIKGKAPNAYIANWNGDRSPVIHQLDRFLPTDTFKSTYQGVLDVMNGIS